MTRRLTSPFILDRLAAGEHRGSLEAATLFADVAGFTAMTSALMAHGQYGAEVGADVMSNLFTPLVDAVYTHGGFITGFAGDAFTAVFPADGPVVDESCASRALAAAEAMREHLRARSRYETPLGVFEVGVKLALAAGSVHWGIVKRSADSGASDGRAASFFRGAAIDACAAGDAYNERGALVLHPSCRPLLRHAGTTIELADGYARMESVAPGLPAPRPVLLAPVDAAAQSAFLSPEIVEQTAVGEYRHVVNVFVNLLGDPDEGELRTVLGLVWDLLANYGGQLCRLDFGEKGCNLLLFWGAPVSYENDVVRALHFMLDLQRDAPMPLRAGVTTAISAAGFVGSDLHAEFTCFGEGVNLAARLMRTAPWGSIWLDDAVHGRAAARFVTRSMGERTFKGFAEPQGVHELVDRRIEVEHPDRPHMIGREDELQTLEAFVAPLQEGRFAGVLVVQGEPGIGKSQLISELLGTGGTGHDGEAEATDTEATDTEATAGRRPWRPLFAPTDAIARRPFHPFQYWLRNHFAQNPRAPERDNRTAFDERLDALLADLPDDTAGDLVRQLTRERSVLGALVDVHWEGSLYSQLDPRARFDHTLDAIVDLLLAESLRQPVVLVLEDVHWIDEGSAEAVRRLVRAASHHGHGDGSTYPIAVLATSRPTDDAPFGDGIDVDVRDIRLTPFARRELATLAAHVLGRPAAPDLLDLLVARTGGNPFFAEQLLHFLLDEGQLLDQGDHWTVNRAAMADTALPVDVKVIFVAQLDRLGRSAREVVQAASVLGREFHHSELHELLRRCDVEPAAIAPALDAGRAAGIWGPIGATRHAFRHILLRDAAYDMQMRARLAQLHHRAALSVEQVWADHLSAHYGDLSHHYESACLLGIEDARQPAIQALANAGSQAATTFAGAAAADLFDRALALTPDDEMERRFELLLEREGANDLQCDRVAQAVDVEALESLAAEIGDPSRKAEAAMRRAYISGDTADFPEALAASDRTLALAREAGLPALESTSLRTGGAALRAMGRLDEASERFEQALAVAQAAQLEYAEATAWTAWSSLSLRRGRWKAAVSALQRVVATFEGMGRIIRVAHAHTELGAAFAAGGHLAEAEVHFLRSVTLSRESGDRHGEIPPLTGLALVQMAHGDLRGADESVARAIELAEQVSDAALRTRAWTARGRAALMNGDLANAHRLLTDAHRAAIDEFPEQRSWILSHLAALALLEGQPADALTFAAEAAELANAVDDRLDLVLAVLYRSLAHEALGDHAAADAGFRTVIDIEAEMESIPGRTWDARAGLARVALAAGRPDDALDAVEPIVAHLDAWRQAGGAGHGLSLCEQPMRVQETAAEVTRQCSGRATGHP